MGSNGRCACHGHERAAGWILRGSLKDPAHHPSTRLIAERARPTSRGGERSAHPIHRIGGRKITGCMGSARNAHLHAQKTAGPDPRQGGPRESGCDGPWNGKKGRGCCSTRQRAAILGTTTRGADATHLTASRRQAKHDSSQLVGPDGWWCECSPSSSGFCGPSSSGLSSAAIGL